MNGMPMISNDLRSSCRALLLQKADKGGGKYDSVYHDILENIVPIIEHYDLGGGFTWTIGEWLSDIGIGGGHFEMYQNGIMSYISGVNTEEKSLMQLNTFRREIYLVGIVYKDNDPLYAAVINEAPDYQAYDSWNSWGITADEKKNTYRSVIYKRLGDYRIDSISDVSYTKFEPVISKMTVSSADGSKSEIITGFNMFFQTDLTYKRTKSWQEYSASSSGSFSEPAVKKSGERTSRTSGYSLSRYDLYPFPRLYGGFSDLDSNTWFNVMQDLTYAVLEKAGAKTEPLKIIQPTD